MSARHGHVVARPTPACAGSTRRGRPTNSGTRAYPRLRGEHSRSSPGRRRSRGLPPLARGAHRGGLRSRAAWGPTPACAGSTGRPRCSRSPPGAYPRLRGEHCVAPAKSFGARGLPPLARGAQLHDLLHREARGPTPACAGSTRYRRSRRARWWAYPRLRGEHAGCPATPGPPDGLPPLARGAPGGGRVQTGYGRPTPACAGSTWLTRCPSACRRAYPRLRGEHPSLSASHALLCGLPPLARGARR